MSRRKKNAGKGYGMMFHGAFASKADAKKKERQTHGFIQPRNIRGERRYVVMSERKNPIRRKKKNRKNADEYTRQHLRKWLDHEGHYGMALYERMLATYDEDPEYWGSHSWPEMYRHLEKQGKTNPMDLMVMGANPGRVVYAAADHTGRRFTDWSSVKDYAVRQAKTYGGQLLEMGVDSGKERVVRSYRKAGERYGRSPGEMENPHERDITVHPGETITLRVNPSAAEIREEFTGRESEYYFISDEPHMPAGDYPKLGDLMGITYKPVAGGQVQAIGWYEGTETNPLHEAAKTLRRLTDAPVLVSATNRRQLYFVAGNQNLSMLIAVYGIAYYKVSPHGGEMWELGEAQTIVYRERKHFDDFELMNYQHKFGEENGKKPTLFYDAGKNRLLLEGGDYEVRPEGIVN